MEFRIVPIALTWSMDDETVNRFFPCNLVFSDRLSVLWARRLSDNLGLNAHRILISNGLSNDCDSALEQRSSYQGHTVDALAMRGEEGRGQLR